MGTVTDYLAGIDDDGRRQMLEHVVALAREAVPGVEEGVSYGMPALLHRGKPLLAVVAAKRHLSLYPFSGSVVESVAADLTGFSLSKGTIRFDVGQPLPDDVLRRIVALRVAQIEASG